ncbi:MAG: hypothetical protein CVU55_05515 [Deltaproteobacteria bacterium HGW-Deltaproteobacteria-13]|jgi:hypothetical protein|nr:MAG: hypothetical protein CVU55_05515 [Deltaproteobacteria bacterium HGW-Deltaproteobacteria-13]
MPKDAKLLKLNRSDFLFLLTNDILPLNQAVTIRFKTTHSVAEIREAARYMLAMYPRLRSIIVPTLFSYRMMILDNGNSRVDALFNDAFQVKRNMAFGTEEFFQYRRGLVNEPCLLDNRLGIKFHYLPDDPNPALIIVLNHVTGDGMSQAFIIDSLMAYLNGKRPDFLHLDDSSMKPALFEKNYFKIPLQLLKSYRILRKESRKNKNDKIIEVSDTHTDYFGPINSYSQPFSVGIKPILSKAKELGCGVSIFMTTALALSILRNQGEDKGDTVGILSSFDMRPYFGDNRPVIGNYLRATMLRAHRKHFDHPKEMMKDLQEQMNVFRKHLENKEILFPWMIEELQKFIGRKNFARIIKGSKRKEIMRMTCHHSTVGSMDFLNAHGDKAHLCGYYTATAHHALFFGLSTLDGEIQSFFTYPEAEHTVDDIRKLYKDLDEEFLRLLELKA